MARKPPGFAFIEYDDERDAEDATKKLDGVPCAQCGSQEGPAQDASHPVLKSCSASSALPAGLHGWRVEASRRGERRPPPRGGDRDRGAPSFRGGGGGGMRSEMKCVPCAGDRVHMAAPPSPPEGLCMLLAEGCVN